VLRTRELTRVLIRAALQDEEEVRAVYGIINRNKCEACERQGDLVCCDFCAAAYHEHCVPFEAPKPDLQSDAPWRCDHALHAPAQPVGGGLTFHRRCDSGARRATPSSSRAARTRRSRTRATRPGRTVATAGACFEPRVGGPFAGA
jgi:hypothetical protein